MVILLRISVILNSTVRLFYDLAVFAEIPVSLSILILRIDQHPVHLVFRKHVGQHLHRRIKNPSRVVAHIDEKLLHPLLLQIIDGILELLGGHLVKLHDIDIPNLILQHLVFHRRHLNLSPLHL